MGELRSGDPCRPRTGGDDDATCGECRTRLSLCPARVSRRVDGYDGGTHSRDPMIVGAEFLEGREQYGIVDCAIVGTEHRAQPVRERGLEVLQLPGADPAAGREGGLVQSLDSFIAEGHLKDAESIEWNSHASSVGEEIHVRRISIARSDSEIVG